MTEIYVEITATKGSAPRDPGTAMKVTLNGLYGTIGGGALEHRAIAKAREILASGGEEFCETLPLGPGLGQCCGGAVTLLYTREKRSIDPQIKPIHQPLAPHTDPKLLWLWGAGHVGRAVVQNCPSDVADVTWVDQAMDRFPTNIPAHVTALPTADMPRLAAHAPIHAHHLIFTYSHDIDLVLCAALLKRGARNIGLIGSQTKWSRFQKRLAASGLDPSVITCPIGDKTLGKLPDAIAKGCIAALVHQTAFGKTA